MKKLSSRQQDVYDKIVELYPEHGRMPTAKELKDACGFSGASNVYEHLKRIAAKGWLVKKGTYYELAAVDACPWCSVSFDKLRKDGIIAPPKKAPTVQRYRFTLVKRVGGVDLGPIHIVTTRVEESDPSGTVTTLMHDGWQAVGQPTII